MNRQQRRRGMSPVRSGLFQEMDARKRIVQEMDRQITQDARKYLDDIQIQKCMWESVIALSEAFGFGEKRAKRFLVAMGNVGEEICRMREADGDEYAWEKVRERVAKITKMPVEPLYENQMCGIRKGSKK